MDTIDRTELKAKLDRGDDFELVMALDEWAFRAKHIPGSKQISDPADAGRLLRPDDEIVVYCSGPACAASLIAASILGARGYTNVRRYVGGLLDWEAAGYPIEGILAR